MSAPIHHGGRLDEAVAAHGGARNRWLDLSTGINPKPYPLPDIAPEAWTRLPDKSAEADALAAVRGAYGVPDGAGVSLAPGSQLHIQLLPMLHKPQAVAVVGFTYQEHAAAWRRAGHEVYITDGLESAEASARIVVLVNPNNPDGTVHDPDELLALAWRLATKGGLLVVDEAFADVTPRASVSGMTGRDGLLVLRSLGKFYGLGGVRFGAALGPVPMIDRLNDLMGPWAVSGPALAVATAALNDGTWRKRTAKRLRRDREKLEDILSAAGLTIAGGTGLFVLTENENAASILERLNRARVLVRHFPQQPQWLRFGMPGDARAYARLAKALAG